MASQTFQGAYLPVYLVLDASPSMWGAPLKEALSFLPQLLDVMETDAVIEDKLRVEVITFGQTAKVEFPLGNGKELRTWLKSGKPQTILPRERWTWYGAAFGKLKERIEGGVKKLQANKYKVYRPAVFFITDGQPKDNPDVRKPAYEALTSPQFEYRPNIICVGVGDASLKSLAPYGTGRYKMSSYTPGNKYLALVAKKNVASAEALRAIVKTLVSSVVTSLHVGDTVIDGADQNQDIPDVIGNNDNLFDGFPEGIFDHYI